MDSKPPAVLTIDELAEYLQVSKSTLYKLVQDGRIPGNKIGKHWRFRWESIDEWLDNRNAHHAAMRHP